MALSDFLEALPEDKREAFKAEVSKAVFITSDADAEKFAEANEFLRKANQKYRDPKIQEFKDRFMKEDLPKLLEEERKKGAKQPWEIEIENLNKKIQEAERTAVLEKQRSRALAKAAELGLPVALVDRFIGPTDEETDAGLKFLAETVIPYRDEYAKAELNKVGGRQPSPLGGATKSNLSEMTLTERMQYASLGPTQKAEVMALANKKG